ncbi:PAP2 superfamily protein [Filimonas lacunae]|nr:PAP2 superfamily protein [Filimonas lacunae]
MVTVSNAPALIAQNNDSTRLYTPKATTVIIPAAMAVYGFTAMHVSRLQQWSYNVHQGVSQINPANHVSVDNYLQWAPAVAVYSLNLAGVKGAHNFKDRTLLFGMATLLQGGASFAIKDATHENRPDNSNLMSFPSGHTSTAFANAEFLRMEYKDVSPWYGIAGYAAAATTGYLRLYNDKHWLHDVIAGAGIGILSTQAAYFLYPRIQKMLSRHKHSPAASY